MLKKIAITIFISAFLIPSTGTALTIPQDNGSLADAAGIGASAYIVMDAKTGEVLLSKNSAQQKIPASLTKLVTALVVLDTKPKLSKPVAMTSADQVVGMCRARGVCVKSKAGVKFTVDGLFNASLIKSANNAANALARSTGLTPSQFAARMNAKAKSLGAVSSHFFEPTGLSPKNIITAHDYAKIMAAAYTNPYLSAIAGKTQYALISTNNPGYNQVINNVDKLLKDGDVVVLGAKTGYLDESAYNFAAQLKLKNGDEMAVVVLGEPHLYVAYEEAKRLAILAETARMLAVVSQSVVETGVMLNN